MLGARRQYLRVAPQVVAVPALGIFLGVLAFNFLGEIDEGALPIGLEVLMAAARRALGAA